MQHFHALTSTLSFKPTTNVVVVGGTQGIGAGIALRFAQLGASVLIVGRNPQLGAEMVIQMRAASAQSNSEGARFEFVRADLGTVKAMEEAAEEIAKIVGKDGVQYLYQTQGGLSAGLLEPSIAQLKTAFNAQTLSHFVIQERLQSCGLLNPGAQSCHIGNPALGKGKMVDVNDIRALKGQEGKGVFTGRLKAIESWVLLFNFIVKEFNTRYPTTHTTHVFPGYVPTQHMVHPAIPLPIRLLSHFAAFLLHVFSSLPILSSLPFLQFGLSPLQCADLLLYETAHADAVGLKVEFWDQKGKEMKLDSYFEDKAISEGVWNALTQLSNDSDEQE